MAMTISKGRRTVGVLLTDTSSPYQTAILRALEAVCAERDVNLVAFADAYLEAESEFHAPRLFAARLAGPDNVDALIVPTLGNLVPRAEIQRFLLGFRPLPLCTVSMDLGVFPNVQIDNGIGIRSVVQHLVEAHGRRHFVFLSRPPEHMEGRVRHRAYVETLDACGIVPLRDIVVPGDPSLDPAIIRRSLAGSGRYDAVVAVDDYLVPCLLQVLEELRIRIPEDVSVTGFDDSDIARGARPPLTSVRQNFYAMMGAALGTVLDQLDGRAAPKDISVAPELVVRRSCGCPYDQVENVGFKPSETGAGLGIAVRFGAERAAIIALWQRLQGLQLEPGTWEVALLDAFESELFRDSGEFSLMLHANFERIFQVGGDVFAWHPVISVLRSRILPLLVGDLPLYTRAETLFQQSRVQVARAETGRAHAQRIHAEILARQQATVSESLLRNLDIGYLLDSLPKLFLQLGVQTFWFSMYPNPDAPLEGTRLASGAVDGSPLVLDTEAALFRPAELVPQRWRPEDERYAWVVHPVHDQHRQLGLLVCRHFGDHGVAFDIMALQIGAALQGALLIQRVAEETERRERAERERLERELKLAQRIQTSILPRDLGVKGLDIAAVMVPAAEVGGDYYDVLPSADGCYLGIGDVAGHGLDAGLVMMMLQSALSTAVTIAPNMRPREAIQAVNKVLHDSIRTRLLQDQHVTLTVLRYRSNGEIVYAGAHEDMLLYRGSSGRVEIVPVSGTWVGVVPNVAHLTTDQRVQLQPGDVLLLYTDGCIEATNADHQPFGLERLIQQLEKLGTEPVATLCAQLLEATQRWLHEQRDDIAFVVARYTG
jgi:sigma-B regulation protein RsbU (phosphoserine phosphatase)